MNKMSYNLLDYVFRIENFLDRDFCKSLVKKLSKMEWEKHGYYDGNTGIGNSFDNDLSIMSPRISEREFIEQKLFLALNQYFSHYNLDWFNTLHKFSPIRFNKYGLSTEMRIHCDHINSLFDGQEKGVPIITMLGSLNEGYKGGDFIMFGHEIIPMNEGTLLIFPSNFLFPHQVTPVTKGTRYSFVSWGW